MRKVRFGQTVQQTTQAYCTKLHFTAAILRPLCLVALQNVCTVEKVGLFFDNARWSDFTDCVAYFQAIFALSLKIEAKAMQSPPQQLKSRKSCNILESLNRRGGLTSTPSSRVQQEGGSLGWLNLNIYSKRLNLLCNSLSAAAVHRIANSFFGALLSRVQRGTAHFSAVLHFPSRVRESLFRAGFFGAKSRKFIQNMLGNFSSNKFCRENDI